MKVITRQSIAIFSAAFSIAAAAAVTTSTPLHSVSAGIDFYAHQGEHCAYHGQIGLDTGNAHANYCIDGKWVVSAASQGQ